MPRSHATAALEPPPTTLGLALIGLVNAEPRTGYAVRMVFERTPIGRFSSSPGSIYPALKRLEAQGLVEQREGGDGARAFHATDRGRQVLMAWLQRPVSPDDYDREPDLTLLRFAFLDAVADTELTLRFLESLQAAIKLSLAGLRAYLRGSDSQALTTHGRLAVEHGECVRASAQRWAQRAHATLQTTPRR
jgi:DNA-binding PadR family transcriptional regulator